MEIPKIIDWYNKTGEMLEPLGLGAFYKETADKLDMLHRRTITQLSRIEQILNYKVQLEARCKEYHELLTVNDIAHNSGPLPAQQFAQPKTQDESRLVKKALDKMRQPPPDKTNG